VKYEIVEREILENPSFHPGALERRRQRHVVEGIREECFHLRAKPDVERVVLGKERKAMHEIAEAVEALAELDFRAHGHLAGESSLQPVVARSETQLALVLAHGGRKRERRLVLDQVSQERAPTGVSWVER
jgi:hypothetical protein